MIKVALVRGKYLNNFEGQNYVFNRKKISITAVSSLKPLDYGFPFPVIELPSPADLQDISFLNKPIKFLMNRLIGDAQILFGLEKLAGKFDIFHTADSHYYYSYQLAKMRKKGLIKKLISTSWETIPFNNETVSQKKFIKKFTQAQVDLFICYTEKAKRCLIKEGISQDKIQVIRLGVDINRFKAHNSSSKLKKIVILFVGRLVDEKGVNDLRTAIKKVQSFNRLIKLKIVQSGSVDYRQIPKAYQESDIFVLPSKTTRTWEEQYGMVIVEAMASGLPIVAYDSGAIKEVVGDAGILVKQNKINDLAETLDSLVKSKELRLKLGTIGRRRAEKYFDARKTAKNIEKIYENISGHSF